MNTIKQSTTINEYQKDDKGCMSFVKTRYPDAEARIDYNSGFVHIKALAPNGKIKMSIAIGPTLPDAWNRAYQITKILSTSKENA